MKNYYQQFNKNNPQKPFLLNSNIVNKIKNIIHLYTYTQV